MSLPDNTGRPDFRAGPFARRTMPVAKNGRLPYNISIASTARPFGGGGREVNGLEKEHGHTHVGLYVQAMAKWLAVALVTGVCCGVVGSLFHIGVERATELREQHPWLLWCLPAAGLVIVAFYKLTKTEGQGTNDIIDAVHHGKPLSIWLLPAIFLGTILTHLCGGSAGREGAALQMGGTIGRHAGNLFQSG